MSSTYESLGDHWKTADATPENLLEISQHLHDIGVLRTFNSDIAFEDSASKIDHVKAYTKDAVLYPVLLQKQLDELDRRGFSTEGLKSVLINYFCECIPSIKNIPGKAKRRI